MLKINIAEGENIHIEANGSVSDILSEFTLAFNYIYNAMAKTDPEEAAHMKLAFQLAVMDSNGLFWEQRNLDGEESITLIKIPEM